MDSKVIRIKTFVQKKIGALENTLSDRSVCGYLRQRVIAELAAFKDVAEEIERVQAIERGGDE